MKSEKNTASISKPLSQPTPLQHRAGPHHCGCTCGSCQHHGTHRKGHGPLEQKPLPDRRASVRPDTSVFQERRPHVAYPLLLSLCFLNKPTFLPSLPNLTQCPLDLLGHQPFGYIFNPFPQQSLHFPCLTENLWISEDNISLQHFCSFF